MRSNNRSLSSQVRNCLTDVLIELDARRSRTVMLILAVALATGTLVAALGISQVAAKQVDADLAAAALNSITVAAAENSNPDENVFPENAVTRVQEQSLVADVGLLNPISGSTHVVVSRAPQVPKLSGEVLVSGATKGFIPAVGGTIPEGVAWLLDTDQPIALVGSSVAERLAIPQGHDLSGVTLTINGASYSVAGIFTTPGNDYSSSVLIPYSKSFEFVDSDRNAYMKVLTVPGGGSPIAQAVRDIVRPDSPQALSASQIYSMETLRQGVSTQLGRFAAFIGVFLLLLTVLLIANAMTVSVMSRISEIGVRRALGASRAIVSNLFLIEGGVIGLLGGLTGSAFAVVAIVGVAGLNGWTADYALWLIPCGPAVGFLTGLASSLYPAFRAAGVQPALAVRAD